MIGEIHLDGFQVSHTKDGFQWEEYEQTFLELLYDELETPSLPMLSQAEGYRARQAQRELTVEADKASQRLADNIRKEVPKILEEQCAELPFSEKLPIAVKPDPHASSRVIEVSHRQETWQIMIDLAMDPAIDDWISIADKPSIGNTPRQITVRMSLMHPFMQQCCRTDSLEIEALARIAAALGLAEITARDAGVPQFGTIRRNLNQLLRESFSRP